MSNCSLRLLLTLLFLLVVAQRSSAEDELADDSSPRLVFERVGYSVDHRVGSPPASHFGLLVRNGGGGELQVAFFVKSNQARFYILPRQPFVLQAGLERVVDIRCPLYLRACATARAHPAPHPALSGNLIHVPRQRHSDAPDQRRQRQPAPCSGAVPRAAARPARYVDVSVLYLGADAAGSAPARQRRAQLEQGARVCGSSLPRCYIYCVWAAHVALGAGKGSEIACAPKSSRCGGCGLGQAEEAASVHAVFGIRG